MTFWQSTKVLFARPAITVVFGGGIFVVAVVGLIASHFDYELATWQEFAAAITGMGLGAWTSLIAEDAGA